MMGSVQNIEKLIVEEDSDLNVWLESPDSDETYDSVQKVFKMRLMITVRCASILVLLNFMGLSVAFQ